MRRVGVILGLLIAGAIGASADTYPRQPGVAIDRYAFAVTLSDANNEIQMGETVDLHATAAGVASVEFDLCGVGPRTPGPVADPCVGARRGGGGASPGGGGLSGAANESAAPTGMTVTAVTSDGKPLTFTHKNDRLHVTFAQPPAAGGRVSLAIAYHGVPSTGLQIGNNKHGDREFFSNDWPQLARNWLAVIDHPSMKAPDSMTVIAPRH
jgi:aminopeptidase N